MLTFTSYVQEERTVIDNVKLIVESRASDLWRSSSVGQLKEFLWTGC